MEGAAKTANSAINKVANSVANITTPVIRSLPALPPVEDIIGSGYDRASLIVLPFTTFLSQFAFAVSAIALFVMLFVNRNIKLSELLWHVMYMGMFVMNTECLSSGKECPTIAALSIVYPVLYLTSLTYYNLVSSVESTSSERRYDD